ncbi:MAG: hypothetical protein R2834_11520 [Rhodothermales bacterium]
MCYAVYLSTTSDEDLAIRNTGLMQFCKDVPEAFEREALAFPHAWRLASRSACSCGFRHLESPELGFGPPEDWYPEEPDDIEATRQFVAIARDLLAGGHRVDCVDVWDDGSAGVPDVQTAEVDLVVVPEDAFRFIKNHRLVLVLT